MNPPPQYSKGRLSLALVLMATSALCTEFSGEIYRVGPAVTSNGTVATIPSRLHSPSQFLEFPSSGMTEIESSIEVATLPLFDDMSRYYTFAGQYVFDSSYAIGLFLGMVTTGDIPVRPFLQGTREQRLNTPEMRPGECSNCPVLENVVYLSHFQFLRTWTGFLPRTSIGSRPIPWHAAIGSNFKYFLEELEGRELYLQNLNLDLGASLHLQWGYNPISQDSDRDILFYANGFEILQTAQTSELRGDVIARESVPSRLHWGIAWTEGIPNLRSSLTLGAQMRIPGSKMPGLGLEWAYRDMLFLRTGWYSDRVSAGAGVRFGWAAVNYAFAYHPLAATYYQLSIQVMSW